MTGIVIAALAGIVRTLACFLHAGGDRADRYVRELTGAPDPVDQAAAEAQHAMSNALNLDAGLADLRQRTQRLRDAARVDWPDSTRSPAANASAGRRRALAVLRHDVGGLAAVSTLAHVEVLDERAAARALQRLAKDYYGDGPIFVAPSDGDDLAATLKQDGVVLARTLPVGQKLTRGEVDQLADAGADVSQIPPERIIGHERGTS